MAEMGLSVGICASSVLITKETIRLGKAETAVHKIAEIPVASKNPFGLRCGISHKTLPCTKKNERVNISINTSYRFSEMLDMPVKLIKVDISLTIQEITKTMDRE